MNYIKKHKKDIINICIYFAFFELFTSFFLVPIINFFTNDIGLILNFSAYLILAVILFIYNFDYLKTDFLEFKSDLRTNIINSMVGYGIVYACSIVAAFILMGLGVTEAAGNQAEVMKFILESPIVVIFPTVLFAPFIEEFIFRKSLFNLIKNKYIAIFVSAIIFGYLHVSAANDYIYMIQYSMLGAALGVVYYKYKNFTTVMITHAINNGLAVIFVLLFSFLF